MNRCLGCGAVMQSDDKDKEGYTRDLENKFCERCFRIKNYNDYIISDKPNEEYLKKIKYISKTNDLVLLTVDFLNIIELDKLSIKNPIILVFTKRDLLPRSVIEEKFMQRIKCKLNIKKKIFISSENNYHLDELYNLIKKYKVTQNVYLIGLTNSGKSTLINKMLKNYSANEGNITTSNMPSTTLDFIKKRVDEELILIDTPGLLDEGNIIFKMDRENMKKIIPTKEINPITYQIKCKQSIIIEDILRLDLDKNNIVIYMSNKLKINRIYKENDKLSNLKSYNIDIEDNEDLVIKGLGFIKFKQKCKIKLYLNKDVNYYTRDSLV